MGIKYCRSKTCVTWQKRASLFSFQARSSSILVMGLASKGREEIKRNRLGMRTPIFSSLSLYSISFTFLCSLSYAVFPLLTSWDKSSMERVLFTLHNWFRGSLAAVSTLAVLSHSVSCGICLLLLVFWQWELYKEGLTFSRLTKFSSPLLDLRDFRIDKTIYQASG